MDKNKYQILTEIERTYDKIGLLTNRISDITSHPEKLEDIIAERMQLLERSKILFELLDKTDEVGAKESEFIKKRELVKQKINKVILLDNFIETQLNVTKSQIKKDLSETVHKKKASNAYLIFSKNNQK